MKKERRKNEDNIRLTNTLVLLKPEKKAAD